MIRSMTGHGVGEATLGPGLVSIEVRAINHRYLDARVRLPPDVSDQTAMVEERVRKSLRRGRIEVLGRIEGDLFGQPKLDLERAKAAFEQLCELRDAIRPDEPVPLSLLASVPDLFGAGCKHDPAATRAAFCTAVDAACAQVWSMREREGAALTRDLSRHLDVLLAQVDKVKEGTPRVIETYRDKLHQRIERLLADASLSLDAGRLEHEVALFADRADVSEELARLASHAEQLRTLLGGDEDAAGKRLDFLLQEMTRETNTIGSKSADAGLAQTVVEMKVAISRMREQAQNVL